RRFPQRPLLHKDLWSRHHRPSNHANGIQRPGWRLPTVAEVRKCDRLPRLTSKGTSAKPTWRASAQSQILVAQRRPAPGLSALRPPAPTAPAASKNREPQPEALFEASGEVTRPGAWALARWAEGGFATAQEVQFRAAVSDARREGRHAL